jgi:hypothetical protein
MEVFPEDWQRGLAVVAHLDGDGRLLPDAAAPDDDRVVVGRLTVVGPHAAVGSEQVASVHVDRRQRLVAQRVADGVDRVVAHRQRVAGVQAAAAALRQPPAVAPEEPVVLLPAIHADEGPHAVVVRQGRRQPGGHDDAGDHEVVGSMEHLDSGAGLHGRGDSARLRQHPLEDVLDRQHRVGPGASGDAVGDERVEVEHAPEVTPGQAASPLDQGVLARSEGLEPPTF